MTYLELETFKGDSSSVVVKEPYYALSNLQPGRNYSISIQAVANSIESTERTIFQATSKYLSGSLFEATVWVKLSSLAIYDAAKCLATLVAHQTTWLLARQLGGAKIQGNEAGKLSFETDIGN